MKDDDAEMEKILHQLNDHVTLNTDWLNEVDINAVFNTTVTQEDVKLNQIEEELKNFKRDVNKRLEAIEEQVVLVRRDHALEEDYEELKEAWDKYNELMEKLRTFKALKDSV